MAAPEARRQYVHSRNQRIVVWIRDGNCAAFAGEVVAGNSRVGPVIMKVGCVVGDVQRVFSKPDGEAPPGTKVHVPPRYSRYNPLGEIPDTDPLVQKLKERGVALEVTLVGPDKIIEELEFVPVETEKEGGIVIYQAPGLRR